MNDMKKIFFIMCAVVGNALYAHDVLDTATDQECRDYKLRSYKFTSNEAAADFYRKMGEKCADYEARERSKKLSDDQDHAE